jgi:hypothetical protein
MKTEYELTKIGIHRGDTITSDTIDNIMERSDKR